MTDAAPKRIWADQENLAWVEVYPGEAMKDYEAEYILASEVAALIGAEREIWTEAIETYFDATAVADVENYVAAIRARKAAP